MKSLKKTYEKPYSKVVEFEIQGIICDSPGNLEPIEPGDEHEW